MLRLRAARAVRQRGVGLTPPMDATPWLHQDPFRRLPVPARTVLNRAAEVARYQAGEVVFREGEPPESLWVVRRGWVQLVMRTANGKGLTADLSTPDDGLFGLSAFCGMSYLTSAVAATPLVVVRLPAPVVRQLVTAHAAFAAAVVRLFSRRFHHMAEIYATAFAPVELRIVSVLLRLEEAFGATLPVTRRQVAELAGTTVETAIRVTNRLRRDRLLTMRRGEIVLADSVGLSQKLRVAG